MTIKMWYSIPTNDHKNVILVLLMVPIKLVFGTRPWVLGLQFTRQHRYKDPNYIQVPTWIYYYFSWNLQPTFWQLMNSPPELSQKPSENRDLWSTIPPRMKRTAIAACTLPDSLLNDLLPSPKLSIKALTEFLLPSQQPKLTLDPHILSHFFSKQAPSIISERLVTSLYAVKWVLFTEQKKCMRCHPHHWCHQSHNSSRVIFISTVL
jgi:hypothetical protein